MPNMYQSKCKKKSIKAQDKIYLYNPEIIEGLYVQKTKTRIFFKMDIWLHKKLKTFIVKKTNDIAMKIKGKYLQYVSKHSLYAVRCSPKLIRKRSYQWKKGNLQNRATNH